MKYSILVVAAALGLSACSDAEKAAAVCDEKIACGYFDIQKTRESSPIFFAGDTPSPIYRLCVEQGSVILQTIGGDGNASSLGVEIRAGSCSEISFSEGIYIIGNTSTSRSRGVYYRVP